MSERACMPKTGLPPHIECSGKPTCDMGAEGLFDREPPRLDARVKVAALLAVNVVAVLNLSFSVEIAVMMCIVAALLYSRLNRTAARCTATYTAAVIIMAFAGGENGIASVLLVVAMVIRKTTPIFGLGYCLVATTKISELLVVMQKLHLPNGITIPFSVVLSYFPSLASEWRNVTGAMKMRGFGVSPKNVAFHLVRTMEYVMVPIIVRSATIAEEISAAAITRGIEAQDARTTVYPMEIGLADVICLVVCACLVAAAVASRMGAIA